MREGELVAGRYRLRERVGAGGMGVVWRAADEHEPRVVALKRTEADQEFATGLRHPNVVAQYESVTEHGDRWLVMEYVPSRNLAEVLREDGPLPPRDAARIGAHLADALDAVHRAGVVHRDVTPGNTLIADDGTVKLTDFGISRPLWNEVTMTQGSLVPGTPGYLAPEVANGADPTRASDLFSLGALLFRAVEGRSAFGDAEHPLVLLRRSAAGEVGRPEHAGALTPVLTALLAVDPSTRPDASRAKALLELVSSGADEKTIRAAVGRRRPFRAAVSRHRPFWAAVSRRRSMRSAVGRRAAVGRLRAGVGHRDPLGSVVGHRDQLESAVGFRGRLGAAVGRRGRLRLAGRRRGWRIAVASAVVVSAAAAVLVTVLPEDQPPPAAAPPFDARSADLCALLIPPALAEFGEVVPEPDRGEFSQCGLLVRTPSGASVDVTAELEPLSITGAPGEDRPGGFQLTRFAGDETGCERHLLPATHEYTVAISVTRRDGVGGPVEFCAIADVATDGALAVLASGRLPRRSVAPDPASLAWQNACGLLAEAAPGRDPVELDHGVGDWSCAHDSPIGPDTVQIRFTRDAPPSAGQKLVFGGRETWLEPSTGDPDSCVARIGYRTYPGPLGQPVAELIEVLADGVADDGACSVAVGTAQPLAYALAD